uniref:H15 domain-containing protein n=1 Tax=Mola mola TaxID=94237 RepID=A0A3Q4BMC9_MOLML
MVCLSAVSRSDSSEFRHSAAVNTTERGNMAEVAPAPAAKKKASKPKKSGPSVSELIVKTVSASKERSGVSLPALKKALAVGGYDVEKNKVRVRTAVRSLVTKGALVQVKGSFKASKKPAEPKAKKPVKKTAPQAKKPAAKKSATPKKPKAAKKPAAAAKKSPKKAKKPAATKKAAKSPKKAAKSPAKSPAKSSKKVPKKAPAAKKKSPVKKVAKPKAKKAAAKKK